MRAQDGISGKKQQQQIQACLRKMWKFKYAKIVFRLFRWTGQQIFATGQ